MDDVDTAIALLDGLQAEHVGRFTEYTWYRVLTLRGHVYRLRGDQKGAARFYLEARERQPNLPAAAAMEVLAYELLGQSQKAFQIASEHRKRFSTSATLISVWAQAAPVSIAFDKLLESIPGHLQDDAEVAAGLAAAAIQRRETAYARKFATVAFQLSPDWLDAKVLHVSAILMPYVLKSFANLPPGVERTLVESAKCLLVECIGQSRRAGNAPRLATLLLQKVLAHQLTGELDVSGDAAKEAYKTDPENEEARLQAAFAEVRSECYDAAVRILDENMETAGPRSKLALAQTLAQRNKDGDRQRALSLLISGIEQVTDESEGLRLSWIETMVKLHLDQKNYAEARTVLLSERGALWLTDLQRGRFEVVISLVEGNVEAAKQRAIQVADAVVPGSSVDDVAALAALLEQLDLFEVALRIWKQVDLELADKRILLRHVIWLAAQLEDDEYVLKLAHNVETSADIDETIVEAKLASLMRTSPQAAEAFLDVLIGSNSLDNQFLRYLRLRRSILGVERQRPELIERDPTKLPDLSGVSENLCEPLVLALRAGGNASIAAEMAYQLVRKFPDSMHAHQAMIQALGPFGDADGPDIPTVPEAAIDTAVKLKDVTSGEEKWYVIEQAANLRPTLNEIAFGSKIGLAIQGKHVGDEVDLEGPFGTTRRVKIEHVLHKWVYRYLCCMEDLPTRFPDQKMLERFRVKENAPPEEAFAELTDFLRREADRHCRGLQLYREHPTPIARLASHLGVTVFEAMRLIAVSEDVDVRCCSGSDEEASAAAELVTLDTKLVLELTAIVTAFHAQQGFGVDVLGGIPERVSVVVTEHTMEALEEVRAHLATGRERLGSAKVDGKIIPHVIAGAQSLRSAEALALLMKRLRQRCEVTPGCSFGGIALEVIE